MSYTIIGQVGCSYCKEAEELLVSEGEPHKVLMLEDHAFLRDHFKQFGFKTVPQIYNGSIHIGGYSELCDYLIGKALHTNG
tara:strand:- start:538 stop:780 length:243 start_codon:yes stop_codon:yes gene_type:complete